MTCRARARGYVSRSVALRTLSLQGDPGIRGDNGTRGYDVSTRTESRTRAKKNPT